MQEELRKIAKKTITEDKFIPGESSIKVSGKVFDEEELVKGMEAILDGWWTDGRFEKEFIKKFSEFTCAKYVLPTNSGSSANLLAFTALTSHLLGEKRIKKGDEVITVAASFPTTINPIIQNGCVPVFVDVDLPGYNINEKQLIKALSPKTKAIFIAHTLGNTFNVEFIKGFCINHNLWLISDCCDALGSTYNGKEVGTFGDLATYSFYPAHHITAGEGGAVTTDNPLLAKIIASLRGWGRDCWCNSGEDDTCKFRFNKEVGSIPYDHKYMYSHMGYNLKWTDMQAAIASAQMDKLPSFIDKRKQNFDYLTLKLKEFKDYFILPIAEKNSEPSWFGFPLTIKKGNGFDRKEFLQYLNNKKIATRLLFAGNIIKQSYFKHLNYRVVGDLINTDTILEYTFWIGCFPGINREMIDYIYLTFKEFIKGLKK